MTAKPDIQAIQARLEKATPGEWRWVEKMLLAGPGEIVLWPRNALAFEDSDGPSGILGACGINAEARADANMEFLAAAHQDIPALLSYIGELEAENARLKAALSVPAVWSESERDGMAKAFAEAGKKHGHYESLFAVGAWLLRHRLAAVTTEEAGE